MLVLYFLDFRHLKLINENGVGRQTKRSMRLGKGVSRKKKTPKFLSTQSEFV